MRFGNRVFKCWKKEGHGSLDLTGAIAASCDVYFYQLGLKLGLNAILEDGVLFGFRDRSGIDLGNEIDPIFPASTAYYDRLYGPAQLEPPAATLNLSIGQGENTQTLINMMRFYEALAGDGKASRLPTWSGRRQRDARPRAHRRPSWTGLRRALIAVVEQGTAAASRGPDLKVAGKTGTAQNPHGKDHGWFIGFAPADKPEIIVGSIMEIARARHVGGALRGAGHPPLPLGAGYGARQGARAIDRSWRPRTPRPGVELDPIAAATAAGLAQHAEPLQ